MPDDVDKRRPVAGTGDDVGSRRHEWFRRGHARCAEALAAGFYLESITLIESMLGDRLESRLGWRRGQSGYPKQVFFAPLGELLRDLRKVESDDDFKKEYDAIGEWTKKRNTAVHQMVKLPPGPATDWGDQYVNLKTWTLDGYACLVRLDRLTNADRKQNGVKRSATQSTLWPDGLPEVL
jgi:hypothetical protein